MSAGFGGGGGQVWMQIFSSAAGSGDQTCVSVVIQECHILVKR